MKEIRISLEQFDLETLLDTTVHFLKEQVSPEVDPTYGIVWIQTVGDVPVFGPESGWDVLSGLNKERWSSFLLHSQMPMEPSRVQTATRIDRHPTMKTLRTK